MSRYKDQFQFWAQKRVVDQPKHTEDKLKGISAEILADTLQENPIPDDSRVELVEQLAHFIDHVKSRETRTDLPLKATQQPIGRSDAIKQLKQLAGALSKVITILDSMDYRVLNLVDRDLIKGDIQLLDIAMKRGVQKRGGGARTSEGIASVVTALAHRLLDHVITVNPEPKKGGRDGAFMRYVATELATIYTKATGKPARRRTSLDGQAYGPFYNFVRDVLEKLNIQLSEERVVRVANDPATWDRLRKDRTELYFTILASVIKSSLPEDLRAEWVNSSSLPENLRAELYSKIYHSLPDHLRAMVDSIPDDR